jgi:hypothetical protein
MAIKGTGFNDSTIRNQTIASGDTLELDGDITVAEGVTVTTGGVEITAGGATVTAGGLDVQAGGASIVGNSSITGNLTVTGTLISQDEEQVLVKDNFLDLNFGYVGTTYEQTGLTFNYQATSSGVSIDTTSNTLTFTAGTTTDRAKVVASTASGIPASTFADGDIVQLNGTTNADNDGMYVVHTNSVAGTVEFKSDTLTSPDDPNAKFALLDVTSETETTSTAVTIRKINLMALRSSSGGELQSATGATDSDFATYVDVGAGSVTLQSAYDNGQSITVDGDDLTIDDTSAGTNDFLIGGTTRFATFDATSDSMTLTAQGTGGADLALLHANSGSSSVVIGYSGTSQFSVDASGINMSTDVTLDKASGGSQEISKDGSNAAGDDLEIKVTGNQDSSLILTGEGSGADALKLQTLTNAGGIDLDSVGTFTCEADDIMTIKMDANSTNNKNVSLISNNTGTGQGNIVLDADDNVDSTIAGTKIWGVDSGGGVIYGGNQLALTDSGDSAQYIVLDGSDGSISFDQADGTANVISKAATASGDDLEIKVTGNQDAGLLLSSEGSGADSLKLETITNSGSIEINSVSQLIQYADDNIIIQMDKNSGDAGSISINANNTGAGAGNVIVDADDNINLQIGASNQATITSSGLALASGSRVNDIHDEDDMVSDDPNGLATQQSIKAYVDDTVTAYQQVTQLADGSGGSISAGDVVAINASGQAIQADADAESTCRVLGICTNVDGSDIYVQQVGNISGLSGLTAGQRLFASTTAGELTSTAPSGTGDVVFQVGYATSTSAMVLAPMFIMEIG